MRRAEVPFGPLCEKGRLAVAGGGHDRDDGRLGCPAEPIEERASLDNAGTRDRGVRRDKRTRTAVLGGAGRYRPTDSFDRAHTRLAPRHSRRSPPKAGGVAGMKRASRHGQRCANPGC